MRPAFSVIIPCFNQGSWLLDAVESVYQQSLPADNYEIVVVDDASTDPHTREVLFRLPESVTQVRLSRNGGLAAARNVGIANASAEFIVPLDGDDRLSPDYLAAVKESIATNPSGGIFYTDVRFFGEDTGIWNLGDFDMAAFLINNSITATACFRKSAWAEVGGYSSLFVDGWEDYDFWMALVRHGHKPVHISKPLFYYRRTKGSMSDRMTHDQRLRAHELLLARHASLFESSGVDVARRTVSMAIDATTHEPAGFVSQVFYPEEGRYSELHTVSKTGTCGRFNVIEFTIPADWEGPLRLDPCNCAARIVVAGLEVHSPQGDCLYSLSKSTTAPPVLGGDITQHVPRTEGATFISLGDDPQILLPAPQHGSIGTTVSVRLNVVPYLLEELPHLGRPAI